MPAQLTYPGVYIEELPSGVRTITGVATSITAFIGRASRGPVNKAVTINSFADFERIFGGLWIDSTMSFAVRDFYLNGGSQAIIVRLYKSQDDANTEQDKAKVTIGALELEAAAKGKWGTGLRATIDTDVSEEVAERMGLTQADLFNLTVTDVSPGGSTEQFRNLSLADSVRRIDKVLEAESQLVRWPGVWPPDPVPAIAEVDDDVSIAEQALKDVLVGDNPDPADVQNAKEEVKAKIAAMQGEDGDDLDINAFAPEGAEAQKIGLYALEQADIFNLLCIPHLKADGSLDTQLISKAAAYCAKRRAILIVDPPATWIDKTDAVAGIKADAPDEIGTRSKNAALFFPRLRQQNPLRDGRFENFAPCGTVAGVFARTDVERGVWKAPAGQDATLRGVPQLSVPLTEDEIGELNPLGVNCLRSLPAAGRVVWGSRTLQGNDRLASEWKYIPVRRTALFIEESLYRATHWVVFEPNDEPLWAQIRLNIGAFMQGLFRQGAFQGASPREAYLVKCDSETTTQADINLGIVNILVGFAPLKPAEFVIIKIQQLAGQLEA